MRSISPPVRLVTRNFFILGSGELCARVIAFIAMIYIARSLGVSAYGVVGFASAIILYFTRLADFGIEALGPREIAEDHRRIRDVAPAVLSARLMIAAGLAVLLFLIGTFALPKPEGTVLAVYGLCLFAVGGGTRWIHLGLENARHVAVARIGGEAANLLLVVILVKGVEDVVLVPFAQFVGDGCAALLMILWIRRQGHALSFQLNWKVAESVFRRSWPFVAATLLGLLIYNSDLVLLRFFRDAQEIGYYVAAYTLVTLLANIGNTYSSSLLPTLTRLGNVAKQQVELFHTTMAQGFAVGLPVSLGGCLLAPKIIGLWFGAAYEASVVALQVLIWSIPPLLIRSLLTAVLISSGRQDRILRTTFWSAALNISLNILIIPSYGMVGAAFTTVATEVVRMLFVYAFVRMEGFSFVNLRRFWRTILASAAMTGVQLIIRPASIWIALVLGVVGYVSALALIGGIRFQRGKLPILTV